MGEWVNNKTNNKTMCWFVCFRACSLSVQFDGAESIAAKFGDLAKNTVSTELHRYAGNTCTCTYKTHTHTAKIGCRFGSQCKQIKYVYIFYIKKYIYIFFFFS